MTHYTARTLGLQKKSLPHSTVEVVGTLKRAGFDAYIVGGGVRDSLLGLAPKDFDVVTNARPHEVKDVFGSRCRIIGKRFMLAHVYSGREMIEVATFRAPPKDDTHTTDEGMITRDNVWGTIEEDFARRDFSINALYYDPIEGVVHDFCGALDDIKSKTLRLLGKASKRIEEDPVRLLRALRFKAKLGFAFDKALAKQFHKDNWALLEQVSAHRLYDETQKMFSGGYLSALLPMLYDTGAIQSLMTHSSEVPSVLATYVAKNTDERIAKGFGTNPAFFYAALLWDNYLHQLAKFKKKMPFYEAQLKAAARVIEHQRQKTAIPKFAEEFITPIWVLQPTLVAPKPKDVPMLLRHPRFRAAYDFLLAREEADANPMSEPTNGMGKWWTTFQLFDDRAKQKMVNELETGNRRRRKKGDQSHQSSAELDQLMQLCLDNTASAQAPKPLFENPKLEGAVLEDPRHKTAKTPKPQKQSVNKQAKSGIFDGYQETVDFERLLKESPIIPAKRRHKTVVLPS